MIALGFHFLHGLYTSIPDAINWQIQNEKKRQRRSICSDGCKRKTGTSVFVFTSEAFCLPLSGINLRQEQCLSQPGPVPFFFFLESVVAVEDSLRGCQSSLGDAA